MKKGKSKGLVIGDMPTGDGGRYKVIGEERYGAKGVEEETRKAWLWLQQGRFDSAPAKKAPPMALFRRAFPVLFGT